MIIFADTETELIRPGCLSPRLVCISYQYEGKEPQLIHANDAYKLVKSWLLSRDLLVWHNAAFDMSVIMAQWPDLIPLVFDKYDRDEVTDTMLRQQLLDIKSGTYRGFANRKGVWIVHKYNLQDLTRRLVGRHLDKDTFRLRYGEYLNIPINLWPEGARLYPLEDARATHDCFMAQPRNIDDEFRQTRAALWLYLSSVWGIKTAESGIELLEKETRAKQTRLIRRLIDARLLRSSGKKRTKAVQARIKAVCLAKNLEIRLTKKLKIAIDEEACRATEDPLLIDFAEFSVLEAVLNKDVKMLRKGYVHPVHTRYTLANTGRSRSSSPNIQNIRRLPGIRECFRPRDGMVFIQADFEGLELRTLAQACLTLLEKSRLAEVLNEGKDPHLAMAADILGISYEEAKANKKRKDVDDARQVAKVANFGIPGGLGIARLVHFAWAIYDVKLIEFDDPDHPEKMSADRLKKKYFETWPEMKQYFRYIESQRGADDKYRIKQLFSNRIAGGCTYTAACNGIFQGLGSDVAKLAGWLVSRACYARPDSPLFGFRVVAFVHDELILEGPVAKAHEAALELERLMVMAAERLLPGVKSSAPPMVMKYWSKESIAVWENGRLVPWEARWCVKVDGQVKHNYYTEQEATKRQAELLAENDNATVEKVAA